MGTGLGAFTGAVVGSESGHAGGGALIGAAAGALAGGLVGNAVDAREERDAAVAQSQYSQAQAQAAAQALSGWDVVQMSKNGISDDVIVNSIRTRGCLFDGTPDNIISLKQQGVSDRVITAMQTSGVRPAAIVGPAPPPVVYAAPPPPPVVVWGRPYYRRGYWGPPPRRYYGTHLHVDL